MEMQGASETTAFSPPHRDRIDGGVGLTQSWADSASASCGTLLPLTSVHLFALHNCPGVEVPLQFVGFLSLNMLPTVWKKSTSDTSPLREKKEIFFKPPNVAYRKLYLGKSLKITKRKRKKKSRKILLILQ